MEDRFDTLNESQKNEVMNFLQITGSEDVNTAIHYMEMSNFDVSNAVNLFFTNQEAGVTGMPQRTTNTRTSQSQSQAGQRRQAPGNNQVPGGPSNEVVREYRKFLARKQETEDNGIGSMIKRSFNATMKGLRNVYNSIMPVFVRGETPGGEEFLEKLLKQFPQLQTYNFQYGTFEENLDKAHEKKLPLLVYFHIDGNQSNPNLIRQVLTDQNIKTYINKSFQVLGLNGRTDQARELSALVNSSTYPCFACFRRSLFEKTELVALQTISSENTNVEFYLEQLKNMKQRFFTLLSEDDGVRTALENRAEQRRIQRDMFINERLFGMMDQQQQPQVSAEQQALQQLRIEEDRMLREAQEEAFREAERLAESQQRQKREEEQRKKDEENLKAKKSNEIKQRIITKRANIPEEPSKSHPEAFTIAFRVPDGSRVVRRFLKNEKTLFDFIECREELEFENEERKFDLVQTFPALSLLEHLGQTVNQIFPDSGQEIIIVKEL